MNLSVIIRNRNEERYIGYAIQSVVDFCGDDVEIIIVDNDSTDDSLRIVNTFDFLDITRVNIDKNEYSPGRSLNIGVKESSNDYTMILSAHCEITNFDFSKVKIQLDSGVGAVWGKQIPIWDGKKISRRYMWSNFKDESSVNYYSESENRYFFHNAFSMFRRQHLREFSFDERLSGKEDRYWANDQIEKGFKIFYDFEQEVKHHYTPNGATWKGTA
tara:strand:- start:18 stop:665 length:648 start_codon:yes stop_codon:yes gene_type:complete